MRQSNLRLPPPSASRSLVRHLPRTRGRGAGGLAVLAVALSAMLHATLAHAQTWEELGPAPTSVSGGSAGRVSSIACSPTDPDLYYVGAADGGVWKTTDGGLTWTPLTDHMPTTAIGAVEIDPFDERIIYAGTGEANFANHSRYGLGLMRSMDAGATWELLAGETFAGRCFSRIACDPATPGVLYASITRAGGFPELAAARGHPQAEGPVGVFRSADWGQTWTRLPGLPELSITDLAIDPFNASVLYAGVGRIFGSPENGVWKTTDGGQTWARLGGGLPTDEIGRVSLAVSPDQAQTVVALLTEPATQTGGSASAIGGFRSTDGGQTWTAYGSVNQATYGWYLSVVSVRPGAADTVFYGGLQMSRRIGGQSATVTPPHVDIHAIEWDAAGRLLSGDDGGVHRSEDLGASWTNLNLGLGTIQFYAGVSTHPSDDDWFVGGTQDNGSSARASGTNSWTHVTGGDGGWTQAFVDGLGRLVVFTESQGTGNLYRSVNGGLSFQGAASGISGRNCFLPPYVVDPSNPQRLLYATERVFESTNGGTQWAALSGDLTAGGSAAIRALAIAPSDARFVYAATNDGRVLASDDGGATFDLLMEDHPGWPRVTRELTVHPTEPETVYLAASAFGADQVRRSRDAGLTWETLDGDLPDVPVNVVVADARCETEVLYAGTDSGVFRSLNGGRNWYRFGDGPNAVVIDLRLEVEGGRERLVIGTQGRGLWRAAVGGECWCRADQNGDGTLSSDDFFAYLSAYAAGDLAGADLTGSALPGVPGFGEPDGVLSGDDFFYYLGLYAAGC